MKTEIRPFGENLMDKRQYVAYLLRLWRENPNTPWRATLENPTTAERISFAELSNLISFLEEQTGEKILAIVSPTTKNDQVSDK